MGQSFRYKLILALQVNLTKNNEQKQNLLIKKITGTETLPIHQFTKMETSRNIQNINSNC